MKTLISLVAVLMLVLMSACNLDKSKDTTQKTAAKKSKAEVEACVQKRIDETHKAHGEDYPIRYDMIAEFEKDCGGSSEIDEGDIEAPPPGEAPQKPKKASSSPGFRVELGQRTAEILGGLTTKVKVIQVIATDDSVTLTDIVVNRGNCKITHDINPNDGFNLYKFPVTIKFGTTFKVESFRCEKVLEVAVTTDRGEYKFAIDD